MKVFIFDLLWSYKDVAIWPRPVQKPHPEIWIPIVGSQESIEFAGRHNIPITPGLAGGGLRDDIIRYYARCLARAGHRLTPNHLSLGLNRGAMPHEMFIEQIRRFASDVLPALQAHEVTRVRATEEVPD